MPLTTLQIPRFYPFLEPLICDFDISLLSLLLVEFGEALLGF